MSCYYGSSLRSKRFQSSYCAKVRAFPSPFLVIHFFFRSCPSFLDEPRKETLATQATMVATFLDHNSGELQRQIQRRQRERQKGNRFILTKQQLCPCITLFFIFLSHHCKSATWNFLIWRARFMELVILWIQPQTILPRFYKLNEIE